MKIKRREFLAGSLIGASGLLLGSPLAVPQAFKPKTFDPYEIVTLGNTKLKASRVGLGTGVRGGKRMSNLRRMEKEKALALIRGAYERGIRLFDLADLYGTHEWFASALEGVPRERYTIVSKIWFRTGGIPESERPDADVVVKRFLKELKTDYIDLVQMHCTVKEDWPDQQKRQLEILDKLKEKGLIRAHGTSCHTLEALSAAAEEPWVDVVHTRINPYGVKMDGPAEKVVPIIRKIHDAGKGVIGMKIIGEGEFRKSEEKKNHSIDFALNLGCVDVMIVGFEKLSEIDDFAKRVRNVPMRV